MAEMYVDDHFSKPRKNSNRTHRTSEKNMSLHKALSIASPDLIKAASSQVPNTAMREASYRGTIEPVDERDYQSKQVSNVTEDELSGKPLEQRETLSENFRTISIFSPVKQKTRGILKNQSDGMLETQRKTGNE